VRGVPVERGRARATSGGAFHFMPPFQDHPRCQIGIRALRPTLAPMKILGTLCTSLCRLVGASSSPVKITEYPSICIRRNGDSDPQPVIPPLHGS
jgi:hypothetical protein